MPERGAAGVRIIAESGSAGRARIKAVLS